MEKVLDYIRKNGMVQRGDRIIAGVSGGPDSVCLLFLLDKYKETLGISLEVVHMEHGIRGKESLEDAAFVENFCRKLAIPCHTYHRDIPKLAREWKCSGEEAGRRARYEAFEEVRGKTGGTKIAVAHNRNDQAETVLFHLVRGSGLSGLSGIRPVRGNIIRPLLCLTREEIEDLLRKENLPFRTDATNLETDYARNRIRLNILPLLREELNPRACEHLAETAERLALAEDYLAGQARETAKRLAGRKTDGGTGLFLDREGFLQEPEALKAYILRYCLREVSEKSVLESKRVLGRENGRKLEEALSGEKLQESEGTFRQQEPENPGVSLYNISSSHLSAITELASRQSGRSLNLPGGLTVHTEGAYLIFDRPGIGKEEQQSETELIVPGTVRYGKYRLTASIFPYKNEIIPEKMYTKWFDYDTIKNTVQIRPRRSGDFLTVTASGGRKTLKKYLIDEKIPAGERDRLCLLADGSQILWVVGHRISEAYKVTEKTSRVLKVQVMED